MVITRLTEIIALADLVLLVLMSGLCLGWFNSLKPAFRYLAIYVWGVTLVELVAKLYYFGVIVGSNLWLLHVYTSFEFIVLSLLYREILSTSAKSKRMFSWYIGTVAVGIGVYSVLALVANFPEKPDLFQLHSKIVVHGSVMVYSGMLLLRILQSPQQYISGFRGLLPVNSALLLYFAGSFAIFLTLRFLVESDLEQTILLWLINAVLTLVLHMLCIFGLWARDSKTAPN